MPINKFNEIISLGKKVLIVLDFDDTVTPFMKAISQQVINWLNSLADKSNVYLAFNSMQTCEYQSGIARQANLAEDLILVGEGGAQIWYKHQMPCKKYLSPVIQGNLKLQQNRLKYIHQIMELMPESVAYYDTPYGITGFLSPDLSISPQVLYQKVMDINIQLEAPFYFNKNEYCLELAIDGISKLGTLEYLKEDLNAEYLIAFGDNQSHDLPMLEASDLGIWFGKPEYANSSHIHHFENIDLFLKELNFQ